ncbi:hypothetical protein CDV31_013239 [Fusarium ambrosium]|uniref:Uncharacterized protein n=1 Tax=Fusarium ambrosium TaxID=131363 RepID=A0A428T4M7_9HYPO|nr:hypothetical protein CDV31_013239 [Fusarium ambrosium]
MGVSRASCAQMWGIEENSRGWRIWLICAVFLGLIVNFIAVLGCLSPATQTIHLYKLQQDELLKSIEMISQKSTRSLENPHFLEFGTGACQAYAMIIIIVINLSHRRSPSAPW